MDPTGESSSTYTVGQRYEAYPYPERNPEDERNRLVRTELDELGALNFYCYRGERDFRTSFRVLIAGGGTGDSVTFLGHQLRETEAEIIYLDISKASLQIAQKRAEVRGFRDRITWLEGSLLDLPVMGLEPFDYINCSGVLHHLDAPVAGLNALTSVLAEGGAMGLMVYGQTGRTGVYHIQDLMRLLSKEDEPLESMIGNARAVIQSVPETNWLKRRWQSTPFSFNLDDIELVDMFLHPVDRAYTVPQLYEWLDGAGLNLIEIAGVQRPFYDARMAIPDANLRARISALPLREQRAIGELFFGTITKHTFWASRSDNTQMEVSNHDTVPFFVPLAREQGIQKALLQAGTQACTLKIGPAGGAQLSMTLKMEPEAHRFMELVDNQRSTSQILDELCEESGDEQSREQIWTVCRRAIEAFRRCDVMLMRRTSSPTL